MSLLRFAQVAIVVSALCPLTWGQEAELKDRVKAARELGKGGSENLSQLEAWMRDPDPEVRREAVKSMVDIGGKGSLDPLLAATRDNDADVQARAVDGLVNFYYPGYVQGRLERLNSKLKSAFTDQNDQIIPAYVTPRPEVIAGIGKIASSGASMDARATAARALGVLRGRAALPDLYNALHTKDSTVLYEALTAIQKINDPAAAPRILFLLNDHDSKVQIAALETAGLLRSPEALPDLQKAYKRAGDKKVKRSALTAIAMIPDPSNRQLFVDATFDKDDGIRAAGYEGLARLKNPVDAAEVQNAFTNEKKMGPRLAEAFALVSMGHTEVTEFSPLLYLVNTLNSRAYKGVAAPYLTELARNPQVLENIYPLLSNATKDEKIGIGRVLAASGDKNAIAPLEKLSKDSDEEVAGESLRALRVLKARVL